MQNSIHQRDLIVGLQKGLAIVQLFSREFPRLTVPQVAKMSGLTPSAARRFLLTLLHERYLETDGRHYWLTPKTLRLGQAYVDSARFPRMVRPVVEYIASRSEEHASVGVIDDDELVYIARSNHTPFSSTSVRLGERVPVYCTAGGRLWLASLPEAECIAVLQRLKREQRTPYTTTGVPELMDKIADVRKQGYATVEKEFEVGMLVLAVPLTDREGLYWGALSITSHQSRTSMEALCRDHLDLLYSAQEMLVA
ncbi:IclR family transcriptional regulator C-terminal domain-containing protein [uncultured Pluralibacter sp.]|uniref:IclR family transcriptional regulator domain-containing protein n=1 Tax=uncultured Pluralibacter sp. TaxID=1490864 RepID=UPI002614E74E|nr:IclR family transcriptional regulator C-terminal domain-containing protein [uncultured Pluralibacter sp.]